ncbi:hypothetical protein POM88_054412 [Heracleum sosnowskyi]|uniref:Uncharacterized protein n=1 Tax=Heracleum sosnowskyi TaxID=360622 RepID=A0AAD8LWX4_9APIA|nr:hypothetical protein POM88_054411 [Heracleum sosnowskyi]KAK1351364.1 hypothetical protein POM88_054412 [Heracleum sosnowskyi]
MRGDAPTKVQNSSRHNAENLCVHSCGSNLWMTARASRLVLRVRFRASRLTATVVEYFENSSRHNAENLCVHSCGSNLWMTARASRLVLRGEEETVRVDRTNLIKTKGKALQLMKYSGRKTTIL